MTDFTSMGVKAIRDGVAGGDFTAREVAEAFNAAVADAAELNAFIVATPDHALAAADAVDAKRAKGEEPLLHILEPPRIEVQLIQNVGKARLRLGQFGKRAVDGRDHEFEPPLGLLRHMGQA